jgi:NADPH:quinone reductase-like Zn-dependent oxidoreductase
MWPLGITLIPGRSIPNYKKPDPTMVRPNTSDMEWMKNQIEAGRIRVIIDRVYPLEQIREALAYSESGRAKGKVVLKVFSA